MLLTLDREYLGRLETDRATIEVDKAQPKEKAMKITHDTSSMFLRP